MKSNLRNGRLVSPPSLREGVTRRQLLAREVASIEEQLADPMRREQRFVNEAAYKSWRRGAESAMTLFKKEERLLAEWIESRSLDLLEAISSSGADDFHAAYELLKKLELEFEFDASESALMEKLDARFEQMDQKQARG